MKHKIEAEAETNTHGGGARPALTRPAGTCLGLQRAGLAAQWEHHRWEHAPPVCFGWWVWFRTVCSIALLSGRTKERKVVIHSCIFLVRHNKLEVPLLRLIAKNVWINRQKLAHKTIMLTSGIWKKIWLDENVYLVKNALFKLKNMYYTIHCFFWICFLVRKSQNNPKNTIFYYRKRILLKKVLISFLMKMHFNLYPRICLLIDRHQSVASCTSFDWGSNPRPSSVHDDAPNNWPDLPLPILNGLRSGPRL